MSMKASRLTTWTYPFGIWYSLPRWWFCFLSTSSSAAHLLNLQMLSSLREQKNPTYHTCLKKFKGPTEGEGSHKENPEDQKIKYHVPPNQNKISSIIFITSIYIFCFLQIQQLSGTEMKINTYVCLSFLFQVLGTIASILFVVILKDFAF